MLVGPYVDVRIERPTSWDWINDFDRLASIDFHPPAAGPEVELIFAMGNTDPHQRDGLKQRVEMRTGRPVLAIRQRVESA
jgi:hypothetical protein